MAGFFFAHSPETPADIPGPTAHAARMDDDREAYEFAHALHLARQVDRETAQLIVDAAEAGLIEIEQATEALRLCLSPADRTGVKASKPKVGKWARLVS